MKRVICFFIGHKLYNESDCGYDHCERCKQHEYYDGIGENKIGWYFTLPHIIVQNYWVTKWKIFGFSRRVFTKCSDCGKPDTFCGKYIGDHSKCLPF